MDKAYELLEKADNAKSKKQAIKYAKEALEVCPDCFDAVLFLADLEDNIIKKEKILDEGLEREKERLTEEGYFEEDNIGIFYGMFETRPYIRGLYIKALLSAKLGKMKIARDVCEEILRLNENDNTGARYLLMAVYSFLEEEDNVLKLYKKYKEEDLMMLAPIMILYYKQSNYKKAKEYLKKIDKVNPNFRKFFSKDIEIDEDNSLGYYSHGDITEVIAWVEAYDFLIDTVGNIGEFILEN